MYKYDMLFMLQLHSLENELIQLNVHFNSLSYLNQLNFNLFIP